MLTFNFTRLFKARGIDKPFTYLVKNGCSENFSTRVVNHRIERMSLKDVEKLCRLFNCTPNDLLQWTPPSGEMVPDDYPLKALIRTDKVIHLTQLLSNIPVDKLPDIEKLINEQMKK